MDFYRTILFSVQRNMSSFFFCREPMFTITNININKIWIEFYLLYNHFLLNKCIILRSHLILYFFFFHHYRHPHLLHPAVRVHPVSPRPPRRRPRTLREQRRDCFGFRGNGHFNQNLEKNGRTSMWTKERIT